MENEAAPGGGDQQAAADEASSPADGSLLQLLESDGGAAAAAADVAAGRHTMVAVVEALQPLLVSPEAAQRARGVQILADVLCSLPADLLDGQETAFVAAFLCDRVRDHFSVVPAALAGINAVVRMRHIAAESLVKLVQSLYKEVHCQSLVLAERRAIYAALRFVLEHRAEDVRTLGADLVLGCVQSMEGEKDPRNLVTVFGTVRLLARAVPLTPLAEDLFEMLACYFPVDFSPPEDSPHGVTRQLLADQLAESMTCTAEFAEFCLPLALEKLNSELTQAKLDALAVVERACASFPGAALAPQLAPLRLALAREALTPRQAEVQAAALRAVAAVSAAVPALGDQWTLPLLTECVHHAAQRGGDRLLPAVTALLVALSEGDRDVVLAAAVPALLDRLESGGDSPAERLDSLRALGTLLAETGAEKSPAAAALRPRLAGVLLAALSDADPALRTAALVALTDNPWTAEEADAATLAKHLSTLSTDEEPAVRSAAVACVRAAAAAHPAAITDHLVRPTLNQLITDDEAGDVTARRLAAVVAGVDELAAVRAALPLLLIRLVRVSRADAAATESTLAALTEIVERTGVLPGVGEYLLTELKLPEKVLELFGAAAREVPFDPLRPAPETQSVGPLHQAAAVSSGGRLLAALVRGLQPRQQSQLLHSAVSLYLQGPGEPLLLALAERWRCLQPLQHAAPWQHTQLTALLVPALAAAHPSVAVPQQEILAVMLTKLALKKDHRLTAARAGKMLAVIVNKLPPLETDRLLKTLTNQLEFLMDACEPEEAEPRPPVVALWGALTKGLVLCCHSQAAYFVRRLVEWLLDETVGDAAAAAFEDLLAEDELLCWQNHCSVRLLFRQWLFTVTCDRLAEGFRSGGGPAGRRRCLRALGAQLTALPASVVSAQLGQLLPLLAGALAELADDAPLAAACLQVLGRAAADAPGAVEPFVDSLVPRLLETARTAAGLQTRAEALRCLARLARLRTHLLLPLKPQVIAELASCIDDKKRLVRAQAVEARNLWFLVGSPGGLK